MAGIGANISIQGYKEVAAAFRALQSRSVERTKQEVAAAGFNVQATALALLAQPGGGRVYTRRGRRHQASAPFAPPATDTGMLKNRVQSFDSLQFFEDGLAVEVGPRNYPVATYLEFGTKSMAPRPFMFPAFQQETAHIMRDLRDALADEMGL